MYILYLHLGQDTVVRTADIIGVFDMDTSTIGKDTSRYLYGKEREGSVVTITPELPRTFVVCASPDEGTKVYISQISSATLHKRILLNRHFA